MDTELFPTVTVTLTGDNFDLFEGSVMGRISNFAKQHNVFDRSVRCEQTFMLCSHLTFASVFASTSPSKFNIVSMEMQTQMHRMGLNPFFAFDGHIEADVNANVKREHTFTLVPDKLKFRKKNNKSIDSRITCP